MMRWLSLFPCVALSAFFLIPGSRPARAELMQCPQATITIDVSIPASWSARSPQYRITDRSRFGGFYTNSPRFGMSLVPNRDYEMPGYGQGIAVWFGPDRKANSYAGCQLGPFLFGRRVDPLALQCWSSYSQSSSLDCRRVSISPIAKHLPWRGIKFRMRDGMGEFAAAGFTPKSSQPTAP